MSFPNRIKQLRDGQSQASFGKRLGLSQSAIANYERGDRNPDTEFIKLICAEFGVTADWLLFGVGESKTGDEPPVLEKKKNQHVVIAHSEENKKGKIGDALPVTTDKVIAVYERLVAAQDEIADLRVERERLLHRIAALEQEVAAAKNGVLPFIAAPGALDAPEPLRGNDVAGEQPTPQSGADATHTVRR